MPEHLEAELAPVAAHLQQQTEELVAAQLRLMGGIGPYRVVPPSELRPAARRNVVRVVAAFHGGEDLPGGVVEDERETGWRRALQCIPLTDVLAAHRRGIALLRDEFLRTARNHGISADAVLVGVQRIWELGDHYGEVLLAGYREAELDLTRREERRRTTLLACLLEGTMTTDQVAVAGVGFGLTAEHDYWVLRARSAGTDPVELARVLERAAGAQGTTLVAPYGSDVAAVLSRPVIGALPDDITVGLAGPAGLSQLRASFAEATQLLRLAVLFGHRGTVDRRRMALQRAVANEPELGKYLHTRYVEPVEAESAMGEVLLASVETYLSRRRSITEAAVALSVHVNTLRNRLERFTSLTKADLQDTETVFEVWWALQYRRVCGSSTQHG